LVCSLQLIPLLCCCQHVVVVVVVVVVTNVSSLLLLDDVADSSSSSSQLLLLALMPSFPAAINLWEFVLIAKLISQFLLLLPSSSSSFLIPFQMLSSNMSTLSSFTSKLDEEGGDNK